MPKTAKSKHEGDFRVKLPEESYADLDKEEKIQLKVIRTVMAMDMLGIVNKDIEEILHLDKSQLRTMRSNHPSLWSIAENDLNVRARHRLTDILTSIVDILKYGEIEALYRLRHVAQGGKRALRVPGYKNIRLSRIEGDVRPADIVAASRAFLTASAKIFDRLIEYARKQDLEEMKLIEADDEFARRVHEHVESVANKPGVAKSLRTHAQTTDKYRDRKSEALDPKNGLIEN